MPLKATVPFSTTPLMAPCWVHTVSGPISPQSRWPIETHADTPVIHAASAHSRHPVKPAPALLPRSPLKDFFIFLQLLSHRNTPQHKQARAHLQVQHELRAPRSLVLRFVLRRAAHTAHANARVASAAEHDESIS